MEKQELIHEIEEYFEKLKFSKFHFMLKDPEKVKYVDFKNDVDHLEASFLDGQRNHFDFILGSGHDLVDFMSADERKHAIYFINDWQKVFPDIYNVKQKLIESTYKYDNPEFDDINLMASRFDTDDEVNMLVTFKLISPMQTVYKKNTFKKFGDNGYRMNKTNSFRIPLNFDFFIFNNILYISDIEKFEWKYSEKLVEFRTRETNSMLKILEEKNFLSSSTCNQLKEYLSRDPKLTKSFLRAQPRLMHASKTVNEINVVSYLRNNFSGYNLTDEKQQININTKKKAKIFIRLLGDEMLISGLTGNLYKVTASNLIESK
ncbi:hypothetical protein IGJ02_003016 [Enterococcus sp. DIV0724b]|uniref:Kiwa anti-phage protein KwaB-like domain-containing protein n=1 Tax=Enterococcus sp. DIV0724b TaxID=2774694 RepID=UPI003D2F9DFC